MFQRSVTRALRTTTRLRPAATLQQARFQSKTAGATAEAGEFARTDESITVEYPPDNELPSSKPVAGAGRGAMNALPTLATFSLEGRVAIVTGGARGLGLVMGQGMVISGADLAIVDLNKEEAARQAESIVETFKKDNPGAKRFRFFRPRFLYHKLDTSN